MYVGDKVVTENGHHGTITSVGYPELDGRDQSNWFWVTMEQTSREELFEESELYLN